MRRGEPRSGGSAAPPGGSRPAVEASRAATGGRGDAVPRGQGVLVYPPLAGDSIKGERAARGRSPGIGGCRVGAPQARAKARRAGGAGGGEAPKRRCVYARAVSLIFSFVSWGGAWRLKSAAGPRQCWKLSVDNFAAIRTNTGSIRTLFRVSRTSAGCCPQGQSDKYRVSRCYSDKCRVQLIDVKVISHQITRLI